MSLSLQRKEQGIILSPLLLWINASRKGLPDPHHVEIIQSTDEARVFLPVVGSKSQAKIG